MIKINEAFDFAMPLTLKHKNGEIIYYVEPYALKYKYLLAKYSEDDEVWYFQNADDDIKRLQRIASHIPWNKVDPWIVKVDDCEVV